MIRVFPLIAVIAGVAFTVNKAIGSKAESHEHGPAMIVHEPRAHEHESPCGDNELSLAALDAVLQMDSDRAMAILRQVLQRDDHCSEELRRKAVFLVSQQNTGEAHELLDRVVRTDPSLEVRKQAVFWLSQVASDRAVDALEAVLLQSSETELQEQAVFALSQHRSARARQILRRYAGQADAPASLRENAIFWLGTEGSAEDQAYLADLYGELASQQLREKIIFAISQRSNDESRRWLLDVARDQTESIELRKNAVFWLSQQGEYWADDFAELYRRSDNLELRQQVLFALSQRPEPAAVMDLIEIARNETDSELRKNALFWLGQSDDPRAAEFLMEVIGR
jgi:HEAT repeat protein